MRLTLRDEKILAELSLNTYSLNQIASTFFTSRKKASERMKKLYDAGLVKRIPHPFASSTGKAEFVYSTKPIKDVYAVPHSLMITDVKLSFLLSFPPCFKSEFYYPKQLNPKAVDLCGVIPDGISIIENVESGKRIVHFVEADCGTEMLKSKR
ncbi:MAG: hypothetical protein OEV42_20335, partial [Deltaproteobacteria bacterium]|nr:hypothetical protein [Deltaproteobacteria bacterium]